MAARAQHAEVPKEVQKVEGKTGAVERKRIGTGTKWPRLEPRPQPMSWADWCFDIVLTFTRPVFQVMAVIYFMHPYWLQIVTYLIEERGWSERLVFAASTVTTHHVVWAYINAFFVLIAHLGWLQQYKLPTTPASEPSFSLKKQAIKESFFGGIPMFFGAFIFYPVYQYFGQPSVLAPLPEPFELWKLLCLVKIGSMLTFDFTHRIIHDKTLYKRVHAKHHSFIATQSMAAEFAEPIEGAGPILVPLFLGMHPMAWCAWLFWEQTNSAVGHSGYCFIFFKGKLAKFLGLGFLAHESAYHHCHHYARGNFSSTFIDHLFGTMDEWLDAGATPEGYFEYLAAKEKERKERAEKSM